MSRHLGWILNVSVGSYLVRIRSVELAHLDVELSFKLRWAHMTRVHNGLHVLALTKLLHFINNVFVDLSVEFNVPIFAIQVFNDGSTDADRFPIAHYTGCGLLWTEHSSFVINCCLILTR